MVSRFWRTASLDLESKKVEDLGVPEPEYVEDQTLDPGVEKTTGKGSSGSRWETYKVVYKDGKEISRELDQEVIRKCQMIFQDPMASLNERAKVDYIVSEGLINYHLYKDEQDRKMKVNRALEEVGLLPEFVSRFPHEFSGDNVRESELQEL